jgi:hypothetical protein
MKKNKASSELAGDKKYIAKRNRLIPMAVRHANSVIGKCPDSPLWIREFHVKMRELAHVELGCPL